MQASFHADSHLPIALEPGFRLYNWYRIDGVLGRGNCGVTYLAHDCNLERTVAIKEYLPAELAVRSSGVFVQPGGSHGEDAYHIGLEAFLNEARLLAKVEHPNSVSIINVFVAQNTAYVVMGYEGGESLEAVLRQRRTLEEAELLQILMPLLAALEKIHDNAHLHGDITPANILLRSDGSPVLVDFGSTRRVVAEQTHTAIHISPGYSAPELYFGKGDHLDPGTDIYALAATLYRAVTGVAPPDALERSEILVRDSKDPLIPCLQVAGPRYSEYLLRAIDCALSLDPAQRPRSVAAWRREFGAPPGGLQGTSILRWEAESPPDLSPPGMKARSGVGKRLHPRRLLTGALLALALLGLGTRAWLHRRDEAAARAPFVQTSPIASSQPSAASGQQSPNSGAPQATASTPISPSREASAQEPKDPVDAKVTELLSQAREDLDAGRLVNPKNGNALDKYRAVLALRPEQSEAKQRLEQIADELIRLSRAAEESRDWALAQEHLDQAGSVLPDLDRLGMARGELQARKLELSKQRRAVEEAARTALAARTPAQAAATARHAIRSGQWKKAEAAIDQIAKTTPNAEELPALRRDLEAARGGAENQPLPDRDDASAQSRKVQAFVRRVHRAMDRRHWEKAQAYLDKATALVPDSEELTLLQGELNVRQASEQPGDSRAPAAPGGAPAEAVAARQTEKVEIRKASVSVASARAGQTIEFSTEYELTLSEGEKDRQVTASWALMRNGRRIGQEGAESSPAKAGIHSSSTELVLPPYMKPGTYVVEHRVVTGHSRDIARSTFRVETD